MKNNFSIKKEALVDLFMDLVKIDSESGDESVLADYLEKRLSAAGISCRLDGYGNLIARIPGQGKPLLLSAHMDTVKPDLGVKPKIKGGKIFSDGTTILGSDDKSGIAEIVSVLEYLCLKKMVHRPIEAVFTRGEETGLHGARNLDFKDLKAREGLVFDRSGKVNTVVVASPFVSSMLIEISGRASHAGAPERGINALAAAVKALNSFKLGRVDDDTTCNAIILEAGTIPNAVPDKAVIKIDLRSHEKAKLEKQRLKVESAFKKSAVVYGAKVKISNDASCVGYKYSLKDPLVKELGSVWRSLGIEPIFEKAGGASDANEFVRKGLKVVDVGYGGKHPHTLHEEASIREMLLATEFLIRLLIL